jgi:peptidyl-prolyl cis-trans isomerase C
MVGRVLVLVLVACLGCRGGKRGDASKPVAHVGDKTITVADLRAELARQPGFAVARLKSLDRKKEFLDGLIRSELLVEEAHRRSLDTDPEVRSAIQQVLIHKLAHVYSEEAEKINPVPESDLRRYYDQHRTDFVTPTRVRVAHLFFAAPTNGPHRAHALADAGRLLEQIKGRAAHGEKQPLELMASQRSEDTATKAAGGDLGYRTREDLTRAWGPALADAAFALKTQGDFGNVVATDKGVHLIKLLGRQEGYETSFEVARSRMAERLKSERRAHAVDELVTELRAKTRVEVDDQALAGVNPEADPAVARGPAPK